MAIKEEKIVMHQTDENGDKVLQFPYVKGDCIETPVPITAGGTGASTADKALANLGALPCSGGKLLGSIRSTTDVNVPVLIAVNSDGAYGGALWLFSPDNPSYKGGFILRCHTVDGGVIDLMGKNDGSLTWQGKNLLTGANVADYIVESYNDGKNWYEVYKSGKVRQGSSNCTPSEGNYFVCHLFKPFANTDYTLMATGGLGTHTTIDGNNNDLRTYNKQTTVFCVYNVHSKLDWVAEGQGV